jgi:hypothetical protein
MTADFGTAHTTAADQLAAALWGLKAPAVAAFAVILS